MVRVGPCGKQRVVALILMRDGRSFTGENLTTNPQPTCPRTAGEGYRKCFSVCGQIGHAEYVAIRQMLVAGYQSSDVERIIVYGHTGPCRACGVLLDSLNLSAVTRFYPDAVPPHLDGDRLREIRDSFVLGQDQPHPFQTK